MTFRRATNLVITCALLALIGCARGSPPKTSSDRGYPLGTLIIATAEMKVPLGVEIAEDPDARARGLMGVKELGEIDGMVFLFDSSTDGGFWMKDTLIPLDIAFWDEELRIIDILQMEPCREDPCQIYEPRASYIGAVEVDRSRFGREGVKVGDRVELFRRDLPD